MTRSESEILNFVACEILNFNDYSYLTAHLDSVLKSTKFDIYLEFSRTSLEAYTNGQFELHTVTSSLRRAKFNVLCANLTAQFTSKFVWRVKSWISLRVKS